jgi:hypothetical protein
MPSHMHKYRFDSKSTNGHIHRLLGYTDRMLGVDRLHFHHFRGISSYDNHTHYYSGITGLPIKTTYGHVHKIEGILRTNHPHRHVFSSYTFEDVAYIKPRIRIWAIGLK